MNSDCRMEQTNTCDSSFASTDSNCPASISFEDRHELNSRLALQSRSCAEQMTNSGALPTLELSSCFEEADDCGSPQESPSVQPCEPIAESSCEPISEPSCEPICEPVLEPIREQPAAPACPDAASGSGDCTESVTPPAQPIETPVEVPAPEYQPVTDAPQEWPEGPALEGGARVELGDGAIPEVLQRYASYENGMLVIDAKGDEIPPLSITRDNVVIRNARIKGLDGPTVGIYGANNVVVEASEITGGQRGILADRSSNITVKNNWLHDFRWAEKFDTTAVEFDHVSDGTIENNRINGLYRSDAISMFESQNLRTNNNNLDITIDEWSSAPLMVEGNTSTGIEVSNNTINYRVGNNVPPGILGGSNHRAYNNLVNGDRSVSAWQMYAYNDVWQGIYFDGQRISPN
jgi:hypothetical protein